MRDDIFQEEKENCRFDTGESGGQKERKWNFYVLLLESTTTPQQLPINFMLCCSFF
jgi:hypothetical protein